MVRRYYIDNRDVDFEDAPWDYMTLQNISGYDCHKKHREGYEHKLNLALNSISSRIMIFSCSIEKHKFIVEISSSVPEGYWNVDEVLETKIIPIISNVSGVFGKLIFRNKLLSM